MDLFQGKSIREVSSLQGVLNEGAIKIKGQMEQSNMKLELELQRDILQAFREEHGTDITDTHNKSRNAWMHGHRASDSL